MTTEAILTPLLARAGTDQPAATAPARAIACGGLELSIHRRVQDIAPLWREFEQSASLSVFQSYDWVETWLASPAGAGERPAIVVGRTEGGVVRFILPLSLSTICGTPVLGFIGQRHANTSLAIAAPDDLETVGADALRQVIETVGDAVGAHAVHLAQQPEIWDGRANPFTQIGRAEEANDSFELALEPDFDHLFTTTFSGDARQKLRRKLKRMTGEFHATLDDSANAEQTRARLDRFLALKGAQLGRTGAPNQFAAPDIQAFYRALAAHPRIGLCVSAVTVADEIVATHVALDFQGRSYALNMAYADASVQVCSPGAQLMRGHVEQACRRGARVLDFGPGQLDYKLKWKARPVRLVSSVLVLRSTGLLAATLIRGRIALARKLKRDPRLLRIARSALAIGARLKPARHQAAKKAPAHPVP